MLTVIRRSLNKIKLPPPIKIYNPKRFSDTIFSKMDGDQFDEKLEEAKTVKALTTKQIKAKIRPMFEADPDRYYPTTFLKSVGFERSKCPVTGHFYWSKDGKSPNCGDSDVTGEYTFIGTQTGIGKEGKQTVSTVWETYKESFCNARIPNTAIDRYPVVARWRNDVDFVLAGIFCFQPYCMTGELDPPANPLVQPQFCARFNDLDNIGLTGRHYSGFIMLGNQVFNKPGKFIYFKEESVEFNYNWLTQGLKIDPSDITFIEDIWAGGGNLGPCMEYFIKGMEIGNMVFMEFKTFPDGSIEKLPITVIDTGIGLERIPWLLNGSFTSYSETFPTAYKYFIEKLNISMDSDIWSKVGPLTCRLNIDEVEDIDKTWQGIAELVNEPVEQIKKAIEPIRDVFIILDHTRTILMLVSDGALPSNVGGGNNLRNILRRTFAIMRKNQWFEKTGFDGYLELYEKHKQDLAGLYGEFKEYKSFNDIIKIEYDRWISTDSSNKDRLDKLIKKTKGILSIDDWILAMTTWGIPADVIASITGLEVPGNLYYEISQREEQVVRAAETVLYDTTSLPETVNLYYANHKKMIFDATVVDIITNLNNANKRNIVVLDQSAFYPTSGGQQNDTGKMTIQGEEYTVVNVEKVGHCVFHILDREVSQETVDLIGKPVQCLIDEERRNQLRCHHTGTHIVFAAAKRVLGPHVWQHGAKKTIKQAHLDITHYSSLTKEQVLEIENEANRIILSSKEIKKSLVDKAEAEKAHGFTLYQGGVVPGNELRVVNIEDTDVEACCGTHCDNTSEVGWVKILTAKRIADGILRLYFVAGNRVIDCLNEETGVINELSSLWTVEQKMIVPTATRFFNENKRYQTANSQMTKTILNMQVSYVCDVPKISKAVIRSGESNPTIYFSFLETRAKDLKEAGKQIVYVGNNFVFGLAPEEGCVDFTLLEAAISTEEGQKIKIIKKSSIGVIILIIDRKRKTRWIFALLITLENSILIK